MIDAKINEYKFFIPTIATRVKSLHNRRSKRIKRINFVSDPTLTLISTSDLHKLPNLRMENVFKIKEFIENFVLKQAKIDLEESKCNFLALYASFRAHIFEQLNLIESIFARLHITTTGIAARFFDNFGNGNFNDDTMLLEGLEQCISSFALGATSPFNENLFKKINIYLESQKNEITEKLKIINSITSKEPLQTNTNIFKNSLILKAEEHLMISEWVKTHPEQNISFELLFNTRDNGFEAKEFHRMCDNKGPTIVFIEATTGKRFGGYAAVPWNANREIFETQSFIFSIDYKEKYLHRNNKKYSLKGANDHGPIFGEGWDIYIKNNCHQNQLNGGEITGTYDWRSRTVNDVFGGYKFTVTNYEVYLVKQ